MKRREKIKKIKEMVEELRKGKKPVSEEKVLEEVVEEPKKKSSRKKKVVKKYD